SPAVGQKALSDSQLPIVAIVAESPTAMLALIACAAGAPGAPGAPGGPGGPGGPFRAGEARPSIRAAVSPVTLGCELPLDGAAPRWTVKVAAGRPAVFFAVRPDADALPVWADTPFPAALFALTPVPFELTTLSPVPVEVFVTDSVADGLALVTPRPNA